MMASICSSIDDLGGELCSSKDYLGGGPTLWQGGGEHRLDGEHMLKH